MLTFRRGFYPGERETHRDLGGLRLVESHYSTVSAMEEHAHPEPFLHLILAGALSETNEKKPRRAEVAQVVYHPPYSPHGTVWQPGGKGFAIQVMKGRAQELADLALLPSQPIHHDAGLISGLILGVRRATYQADSAATLTVEELLLEILAELRRTPESYERATRPPSWLWQAREILHEMCAEPPSLTQLAATVGVHPVYLARTFQRYFHETVGDCIRRRRLELACRQIAASHQTLTQIALEAGFADQGHFTRTFKKQLGFTPSEYVHSLPLKKELSKG
jgi:AraC family transcriptional regulator